MNDVKFITECILVACGTKLAFVFDLRDIVSRPYLYSYLKLLNLVCLYDLNRYFIVFLDKDKDIVNKIIGDSMNLSKKIVLEMHSRFAINMELINNTPVYDIILMSVYGTEISSCTVPVDSYTQFDTRFIIENLHKMSKMLPVNTKITILHRKRVGRNNVSEINPGFPI